MPLDKEKECIYKVNAEKGIKCEGRCENCPHYKNINIK